MKISIEEKGQISLDVEVPSEEEWHHSSI